MRRGRRIKREKTLRDMIRQIPQLQTEAFFLNLMSWGFLHGSLSPRIRGRGRAHLLILAYVLNMTETGRLPLSELSYLWCGRIF